MNETNHCLSTRRALLSDPYRPSQAVRQHLDNCTQCQAFSAKLNALNADISSCMEIDAPSRLANKILLAKDVRNTRQYKQNRQRLIFAFAGLMLVLSSIAIYFHRDESLQLEQVALNHVHEELHHLDDKKNIQLSQLNTILSSFNLKLTDIPNIINYAGTCEINQSRGAHIVFQGEQAPITMLLMPNDISKNRKDIMGTRFKGVILPIEKGSIALIADKNENLSLFERQIYQHLIVI